MEKKRKVQPNFIARVPRNVTDDSEVFYLRCPKCGACVGTFAPGSMVLQHTPCGYQKGDDDDAPTN